MTLLMRVYRVQFTIIGEWDDTHTTYIHAGTPDEALQKLTNRFPAKAKDIHVVSIHEDHGEFVIGSEERQF